MSAHKMFEEIKRKIPSTIMIGSVCLFLGTVFQTIYVFGFEKGSKWPEWIKISYMICLLVLGISFVYEMVLRPMMLNKKWLSWIVFLVERLINYLTIAAVFVRRVILWPFKVLIVGPIVDDMMRDLSRNITTRVDHFPDLQKWSIVEGVPQITKNGDDNVLELPVSGQSSRNSFVSLKDTISQKGRIRFKLFLCDENSILNLIIGADDSFTNYFMIRFDARQNSENGILKAQDKYGWNYIYSDDGHTPHNRWVPVEVDFERQKIFVKIDGKPVSKYYLSDDVIPYGNIGIFNEVGRAMVKDFEFSQE